MLSNKIKLVLAFVLSAYGREALAQISPGYVQQETIKLPGKTTDAQIDALSVTDKQVTRTYIDGMGRTLQQVAVQASPLQNDIIQPLVYDNLGRQTIGYLPYAGKSTDIDGSYRVNAITDQAAFYNNGTADKVADDSSPYSQQVFENSPLQRLLTAGMAGSGFQPTVAGNHYKTVKYRYNNTTTDGNILTWNADGTFTTGTYYADNTLAVTDGIDEDNMETLSYADIAGRTILKRQILSGGNLDTYYIYNLAGAISYVVPPKATTLLSANSYNLSVAPLSNLVFKYLYDARGRIIEKTVPAKGKMVIVYDPLNRPVLLQDANMATANKWNYIKYDSKNRSISQGIYLDNTNIGRANMQTYVSGLSVYNTAWYENRSGTLTNGGYYTNSSFPSTGITPLAYAYFDNYDLNQDGTADFSYSAQGLSGEGSATTAPLKGVPTIISQTTVGAGLTNTWLTKVTFYDKRGNTIQVKSNNQVYYTGATTLTDTKTVVPDFTGAPQVSLIVKKSSATATLTVQTTLSYDHMKRVTAVDQRYNGAAPVRVAAYTYNEMGQLVDKNLGSTNVGNTAWLQSVDMRYNIHGQLLSINNSKLSNDGVKNDDSNDLFGMEMLYDQSDANLANTVRYNGNLSAVKWMTKNGSGVSTYERSYKYSYDAVNRYTGASYAERTTAGTGAFNNNIGGFNEAVGSYDAGGNILTLTRNSSTQGTNSNVQVDNLAYSYDANNPNQLKTVTDGTGTNYTGFGFRNLTGTTTGNYTYDVNGNLTADPYKGLTINYNVLNRTDKITVTTSTGRYINYTYDAGGTLIRKQAYDNNVLGTTTDYVDGFVYLNGVISYFAMPEGRVRNTGSGTTVTLKQEFIITDQQGNARISFEDNGSAVAVVRQENSYYGFGLTLANSPVATPVTDNKQLYNGGSEWQNDYNNLPDLQQTFYRNYDAALGRWIAVDPVAESAESMTVYQYAGNNPIMMNDPLGDLLPDPGSKDAPIPWHTDTSWHGKGGPDPVGDWAADMSKAAEVANEIGNAGGYVSGADDLFTYVYLQIRDARENNGYTTMGGVTYDGSVRIRWETTWAYSDKSGLYGGVISHTTKFNVNSYSYGGDNGSAGDIGRGGANQGGGDESFDWYGNYGKANAFVGTEVFLLDQAQAAGHLEMAAESVKGLKGLGVAGGIAGMTMDGIGVYNYYHPTAANIDSRVSPGKFGADGVMTAVGIWGGPVGAGASVLYFGIDAFAPGFWPGVGAFIKDAQRENESHADDLMWHVH